MEITTRKIKEEEIGKIEEELQRGEETKFISSIYIPNCHLILCDKKEVGLCEFYRLNNKAVDVNLTLFPAYRNKKLAYPIWREVREIYEKKHPYIEKVYWLVAPGNTKALHVAQHDMEFDFAFYQDIQKEGCHTHYPYFSINPYYKGKKKEERGKELTYPKMDAKIKIESEDRD